MAGDRLDPPQLIVQPAHDRLDSWKEIASYLRKDIRTVQRWEKSLGLPVRRLAHGKLGAVFAYKHELDAWWKESQSKLAIEDDKSKGGGDSSELDLVFEERVLDPVEEDKVDDEIRLGKTRRNRVRPLRWHSFAFSPRVSDTSYRLGTPDHRVVRGAHAQDNFGGSAVQEFE